MNGETRDTLLGGRVRLIQAADGYRVSIDAVFLAASVGLDGPARVLDVGCGVGGATLCLAARVPEIRIDGIDADAEAIARARINAGENGCAERLDLMVGDVADGAAPELRGAYDVVMSNPPYLPPERADRRGSDPARDRANVETVPLAAWLSFMLDCARAGGRVHLVHRADRLDDILAVLAPHAGDICVYPLWPRTGAAAKRVLVAAHKDSRAPMRLCSGLVLHEADGSYTAAARAVLEAGAPLTP